MTTSILRQFSEHVSRMSKHKLVYKPLVNVSKVRLYAPLCMRRLTKGRTGEVFVTASS